MKNSDEFYYHLKNVLSNLGLRDKTAESTARLFKRRVDQIVSRSTVTDKSFVQGTPPKDGMRYPCLYEPTGRILGCKWDDRKDGEDKWVWDYPAILYKPRAYLPIVMDGYKLTEER
ncbi:MAG: hypothetical protein ACOCTU_07325 [Bacteroidota bacterium]